MKRALACIAIALAVGTGCSGERDARSLLAPKGGGTIVVEGRLIVSGEFPEIHLSITQAPDQAPMGDAPPLRGASLFLTTGSVDTVWYEELNSPGSYRPFRGTPGLLNEVRPRTTYRLKVSAADGRIVTAQTTTPDTFSVREWLLVDSNTLAARRTIAPFDTLYYQDGLVEARFDCGNALAFQMALFNLETNSPLLLDADFIDPADLATLERRSSSPPLEAPDGYVRLPWLAVWYEGRHEFAVYSVDQNWYDVARSVRFNGPANLGFGSNAGDDFERPLFHVQGGIGLFGSAAVDYTYFTVWPRP